MPTKMVFFFFVRIYAFDLINSLYYCANSSFQDRRGPSENSSGDRIDDNNYYRKYGGFSTRVLSDNPTEKCEEKKNRMHNPVATPPDTYAAYCDLLRRIGRATFQSLISEKFEMNVHKNAYSKFKKKKNSSRSACAHHSARNSDLFSYRFTPSICWTDGREI